MIVAPLTITYARNTYIDYSMPFTMESIGILIKFTQKKVSLWNMVWVFTPEVWLTILATAIGAVIITHVLYQLEVWFQQDLSEPKSIYYCVWLTYGGLLNQSKYLFGS